ncbi:UDP binding domain-containing protein [Streptomyces sp. LaPpAH-108]|uniref:UDP binding domain-containing protein n=1 Tax=Streptomyces sp. LaPpAH-108 TaxID=1155714 RepID=UPI00039C1424|nr:UDP binding domain-containing protein [Streptomyces sp. LaPpAH-108]
MPDVLLIGDWHLASVTAAGLTRLGYTVHLWPDAVETPDRAAFDALTRGHRCGDEPEIAGILATAREKGTLRPVLGEAQAAQVLRHADMSVVVHDTGTAADGTVTDTRPVTALRRLLGDHRRHGPVVVASQLRAGTCDTALATAGLPVDSPDLIHIPENLRLGRAITDFLHPVRTVVGCNAPQLPQAVSDLLERLGSCDELHMRLVEAELVKHGTNAYLALCITLANELGTIAGHFGADPVTVLDGVRADERVAAGAPLRPGEPYAGATLHRDVRALVEHGEPIGRDGLFRAVAHANAVHALAPLAALDKHLEGVAERTVCLLGLTYKPGVSTLRDSAALRLADELHAQGARVTAFDPIAETADLRDLHRCTTFTEAAADADCVVLTVEHPAFTEPAFFESATPRHALLLRLTQAERRSRVPTPRGWKSVDLWNS